MLETSQLSLLWYAQGHPASSGAQVNVVHHECGMTIIMQQARDQISFILVIMLETSQLDTVYFYKGA